MKIKLIGKIFLFFLIVFVTACGGAKIEDLLGKWTTSLTKALIGIGNREVIEFKADGTVIQEYYLDDELLKEETSYFKWINGSTIWLCDSQESCTKENAIVMKFSIREGILYFLKDSDPTASQPWTRVP
jgi:hypothetical protein